MPTRLGRDLALPVIGAPMFIVSGPDLVVAQCRSGIVGAFPALNARPKEELERWITSIKQQLRAYEGCRPAPFAVNLIVQAANDRFQHDLDVCIRQEVPIVITSLGAPRNVVPRVHAYGGMVIHDVASVRHAKKALEAGVDGVILLCAGAGGHGGTLNPFAFAGEIRKFYDGLVVISGAISTGAGILAAQALGADIAYMGTRFIATAEAVAPENYKRMLLEATAADIVNTSFFTGFPGNYLRGSIVAAGLDPDDLPTGIGKTSAAEKERMELLSEIYTKGHARAWRDIWGAGHGVGMIDDSPPAAAVVGRLGAEYQAARRSLLAQERDAELENRAPSV